MYMYIYRYVHMHFHMLSEWLQFSAMALQNTNNSRAENVRKACADKRKERGVSRHVLVEFLFVLVLASSCPILFELCPSVGITKQLEARSTNPF